MESLPTARLLLLVNYRPEYQHGWGSKTYYLSSGSIPCPPRAPTPSSRAPWVEDPASSRSNGRLIERTEGNPFFLEESVQPSWRPRRWSGSAAPTDS